MENKQVGSSENDGTPLQRFMAIRHKSREASKANFAEESRKRLDKILSTKMQTTFIGALSTFEKAFGFLWGQGKRAEERTEEEQQFHEVWQNVRTDVLNNGNNQLRALRNELQNHSITWNRHNIVISAKPEQEEDNG